MLIYRNEKSHADLPGRRKTGIVVVQSLEQQSVDWFEMVILLEKLKPKENSKMSAVDLFLLAIKKSDGKRSVLSRNRAVDMTCFPVLDGG